MVLFVLDGIGDVCAIAACPYVVELSTIGRDGTKRLGDLGLHFVMMVIFYEIDVIARRIA